MKKLKKAILIVAINLVVLVVLLEIIARLLPVQDSTNVQPVTEDQPYIHLAPNRDITSSFGPRMDGVTEKHSNNYGYFSDRDYIKDGSPEITVIGDSYVEAMQVANQDSIGGQLDQMLGADKTVYSIGFSGSPLSQYLAFAQFAKTEFSPKSYVFVIIANDFDESLLEFKSSPGFFYYNREDTLELIEYAPSALKEIARKSAFMRYLVLNLHAPELVSALMRPKPENPQTAYHNNTIAFASDHRITRSKHAIDLFLRDIDALLGTENVYFVMDGDRSDIYTNGNRTRNTDYYANIMFEHFKEQGTSLGFEVVDMHPIFADQFAQHQSHFEPPYDAHWNELGHKLVAETVFARIQSAAQ
ncbi:hypothetical protein LPB41_29045 [Thalassospira sp. MA62]|nr:hypothetical protein [Thalassospira sp. MA62]